MTLYATLIEIRSRTVVAEPAEPPRPPLTHAECVAMDDMAEWGVSNAQRFAPEEQP